MNYEWYGCELYKDCLKRQIEKHGTNWITNAENFDFSELDYSDLQDMATVAAELSYERTTIENISGLKSDILHFMETSNQLKNALNTVVYNMLGEFVATFKAYYSRCACYDGDQIYSLLVLSNRHDYDCFDVLKRIVALKHVISEIKTGSISEVEAMRLMERYSGGNSFLIGDIAKEPNLYSTDISFEEKNKAREKAVKERVNFVKTVLKHKNFKLAYKLLKIK